MYYFHGTFFIAHASWVEYRKFFISDSGYDPICNPLKNGRPELTSKKYFYSSDNATFDRFISHVLSVIRDRERERAKKRRK